MGNCYSHNGDFLLAYNSGDLASMMVKEKENFRAAINESVAGEEEKISFLQQICDDIDLFSQQIKEMDFKEKFGELKKFVNEYFLAVRRNDKDLYYQKKLILDQFLKENNVLEI